MVLLFDERIFEMTEQQPTTKLHTNYPPVPEPKHSRVVDGLPCITVYEHQNLMRAYVDADRTMRTRAAPAAHGDALSWLQANDMAALERFAETTDDDESYDIGKDAVQRLAGFGCLRSHGFGKYSITDFGHYVLNYRSLARELPFKSQSERTHGIGIKKGDSHD